MTLSTSPNTESRVAASTETSKNASPAAELTASVFMGGKPVLKNWKIYGETPQDVAEPVEPVEAKEAPLDEVKPPRQYSDHVIHTARPIAPIWLQIGQALAVFATVAWITYAGIYLFALPNLVKTVTSSPLALGGVLASVLAPVAMLWLCIATWQRRSDAHIYAEALREELRGLFYPSADQHNLIGEDIRGLMRQATEMSATSRGAIKAIQRARTGLRAEIRDFAGVSQKAEFHIDRLAESLSKRAEELLSLTETIESQTENISSKAQRGIGAWENVSAEISELGDEIDRMFSANTQKLAESSEKAVATVGVIEVSLTEAVEKLSSRISGVSGQIDVTRGRMDDQVDRLEDISQSIADGADRLQTSLTGAEQISKSIETVMETVAVNLDQVEETADMFLTRTEEIDGKLATRVELIKDVVGELLSSTDGVQESGDLALHKMGEAVSMAVSGADTLVNAVRRSKDMMDKTVTEATTQMEQTSRIADEKLAALMTEAKANRDQLAQLIADIEEKQALLAQSTRAVDSSREQIMATAELAVSGLQAAADQMVARTDEPLKLIQTSIDRLGTQSDMLDDKLSVRVVEINQETGKLKSFIEDINTSLDLRIQGLTEAIDQVNVQSQSLDDQVSAQRSSLNAFVLDMEGKTKSVATMLSEQRDDLEKSVMMAGDKISTLGATFFDKGDSLIEKVRHVSEQVTEYETTLYNALLSVDQKSVDVADRVQSQIVHMTNLSDALVPQAERFLSQAEALYGQFDDLKSGCLSATEQATESLSDLGEKLESHIIRLGQETTATSNAFVASTQDMTSSLQEIRDVAGEAQERIVQIQSGMKDRVDDLHLVSDQIQIKVEALQDSLGGYAKDLSDVLQFSVSDLDVATEKFGKTAAMLDDRAGAVSDKILEATRLYTEEGHRMSLMAEQATHKSVRIVAVIQQESDKLVQSTKSSLLELQKSGETLSVRTKEIEDYLRTTIHHTKTYSDELRGQASLIASHSMDVVDQISSAATNLSARANDVKLAGQAVVEDMGATCQKLGEETRSLGRMAKMTITAVDDVVTDFAQQSRLMETSIGGLVEKIESVKEVHARTERESFLSAAKFVIESLYSLAVDVSRHLEGDLDARALRAYQKGDVSAYVRHLVDSVPKLPVEKSQRKFIEDSEFRTYVLRFIRQYEELLEQAQANDYADLLASVFSTSDIGKLYKSLCEVAGRNSKEH